MKNLGTIAAAVFLGIVLALYMCTFQVRFTEVAIKKTWGRAGKEPITNPGLYFKWPKPIQSVVIYDGRVRLLEDRTEETRTIDGKNLLLTSFTLWRIHDPVTFHTNFPAGEQDGEKKLRTTIITNKHAVTGRHTFSEFVSTDPKERKIRQIEQEMKAAVARDTLDQYGVQVVDFGIKKLGLPESVTTAIFESMKSHEEAKAQNYRSEGDAAYAKILADAGAIESRILAEVDHKVADIHREAERIVSEYYKEFDEYPALRIFLDTLRTLRESLKERTTLILTDAQAPWSMFNEQTRIAIPSMDLSQDVEVGPPAIEPD